MTLISFGVKLTDCGHHQALILIVVLMLLKCSFIFRQNLNQARSGEISPFILAGLLIYRAFSAKLLVIHIKTIFH